MKLSKQYHLDIVKDYIAFSIQARCVSSSSHLCFPGVHISTNVPNGVSPPPNGHRNLRRSYSPLPHCRLANGWAPSWPVDQSLNSLHTGDCGKHPVSSLEFLGEPNGYAGHPLTSFSRGTSTAKDSGNWVEKSTQVTKGITHW